MKGRWRIAEDAEESEAAEGVRQRFQPNQRGQRFKRHFPRSFIGKVLRRELAKKHEEGER